MKDELALQAPFEADPFGLRKVDFSVRIPEESEMFSPQQATDYIEGCDYPESVDDLLFALEILRMFGSEALSRMRILDAMAGPGRLGRELSRMGANFVISHDGDPIMIAHAAKQAVSLNGHMGLIKSPVESIPLKENSFDLVACHNATHQLASHERLREVLTEFTRLIKPGGHMVIADYQRGNSPEFISRLERRLRWTRPEIVPLLIPTFIASFAKEEFENALKSVPGIEWCSVTDAQVPKNLPRETWIQIKADPVKGHILDFSEISLRAIARKEGS